MSDEKKNEMTEELKNPLFSNTYDSTDDDNNSQESVSSPSSDETPSSDTNDDECDEKTTKSNDKNQKPLNNGNNIKKKKKKKKKKNTSMKNKTKKNNGNHNQNTMQLNSGGYPMYGGKGDAHPQFGGKGLPQFGGKTVPRPRTGGKTAVFDQMVKNHEQQINGDNDDTSEESEEEKKPTKKRKRSSRKGAKYNRLNGIQLYPFIPLKSNKINDKISAKELLVIFVPHEGSDNVSSDLLAIKYSSTGGARPGFLSPYQWRQYKIKYKKSEIISESMKYMDQHKKYKERILKIINSLDDDKYMKYSTTMGDLRKGEHRQTLHYETINGQTKLSSNSKNNTNDNNNKSRMKKKKKLTNGKSRKSSKSNGDIVDSESDNDDQSVSANTPMIKTYTPFNISEFEISINEPNNLSEFLDTMGNIDTMYNNAFQELDRNRKSMELNYKKSIAKLRNKTKKNILHEFEKLK